MNRTKNEIFFNQPINIDEALNKVNTDAIYNFYNAAKLTNLI